MTERYKLRLSNLSFVVRNDDLREKCSKYGKVVDMGVDLNESELSRGTGFVCYDSENEVMEAMSALKGELWDRRKVEVELEIISVDVPKGRK